jgi:hypothetical protein
LASRGFDPSASLEDIARTRFQIGAARFRAAPRAR